MSEEEYICTNSRLREAAKMALLIGLVVVGLSLCMESVIATILGLIIYLASVIE